VWLAASDITAIQNIPLCQSWIYIAHKRKASNELTSYLLKLHSEKTRLYRIKAEIALGRPL